MAGVVRGHRDAARALASSFELIVCDDGSTDGTWAELQRSCDYLARNGIHLVWGPIRHIVGHNIAAYHRNPDDQRVELFCELDVMRDEELGYFEPRPWHRDLPQKPKVWAKDPSASNLWGIMPTDEMHK